MKYFESKAELIEFIKKQTNVELKNIDGFCGDNPDLLYAEIPREERNLVLSVCRKHGIETNEHLNDRYWFYVKRRCRVMDYAKHIELENIYEVVDDCKIRKNIVAQIVDMTDKVILETIIEFAKSAGITDLYLLDKEFVKTALEREIARRKGGVE